MQKAREALTCGLRWRMDYLEFKLWKLGLMALVAFAWGVYCGATGRSLSGERHDNHPAKD